MTCWVYRTIRDGDYYLRTVGFYDPDGKWQTESDHREKSAAAARVNYLNGGRQAVSCGDDSGVDLGAMP